MLDSVILSVTEGGAKDLQYLSKQTRREAALNETRFPSAYLRLHFTKRAIVIAAATFYFAPAFASHWKQSSYPSGSCSDICFIP